jgi:glycosyltransferase involved in cell wall biosynthesis
LPIVSVVIPTYNRARFLPEVLEAVFAQRDCPSFEVILVDDGSTDDTAAVVGRLPHPVAIVTLPRNTGVAAARQAGVARARGTLLAFHDSDDLMLPGRLGVLAAYLAAHPEVGTVLGNGEVERPDGTIADRVVPAEVAARLDGRTVGVRDILREGLPVYLQAALIRRAIFDAAGGIDTALDWHADMELGCRLALTAPLVFLDRPLFRYRLHGDNVTSDRLRLREGFVTAIRRLRARRPEVLDAVGERWLREREARHLYRIARARWGAGDRDGARTAIGDAVVLEPRSLRYRWLAWRLGRAAALQVVR